MRVSLCLGCDSKSQATTIAATWLGGVRVFGLQCTGTARLHLACSDHLPRLFLSLCSLSHATGARRCGWPLCWLGRWHMAARSLPESGFPARSRRCGLRSLRAHRGWLSRSLRTGVSGRQGGRGSALGRDSHGRRQRMGTRKAWSRGRRQGVRKARKVHVDRRSHRFLVSIMPRTQNKIVYFTA